MIVVISNRKVTSQGAISSPKLLPISVLGNDLSDGGNVCGILQRQQSGKGERIRLFPQGQEEAMFADLVERIDAAAPDHELRRPWVMFVHGFNQTTEKNIRKARNLEKRRKVNVIAFSWPSRPHPGKTDKVMKVIKSKAISKFVRCNLTSVGIGVLSDFVEDYWRSYTLAKMNAESSADDLAAACRLVQNRLIKQTRRKLTISLMIHSLGSYLAQNTVSAHGGIAAKFQHIILHQADTASAEQKSWIPALARSAQRAYVTINKFDSVLAVSQVYNQKARLGHSRQGFIQSSKVFYCDFTGIPSIFWSDGTGENMNQNDHGLFDLPLNKCADDMYHVLTRLIRSEKAGLPSGFAKSANGFMKTRRKINYYQPQLIVDDFGDVISPL